MHQPFVDGLNPTHLWWIWGWFASALLTGSYSMQWFIAFYAKIGSFNTKLVGFGIHGFHQGCSKHDLPMSNVCSQSLTMSSLLIGLSTCAMVITWVATGLEPPRSVAGWDWWDPCRSSRVIEAMVAGSSPMHFLHIFCFAQVCPSQRIVTCRFIIHWTSTSHLISKIFDTCDSSSSFCSLSCCLGMACSQRPSTKS